MSSKIKCKLIWYLNTITVVLLSIALHYKRMVEKKYPLYYKYLTLTNDEEKLLKENKLEIEKYIIDSKNQRIIDFYPEDSFSAFKEDIFVYKVSPKTCLIKFRVDNNNKVNQEYEIKNIVKKLHALHKTQEHTNSKDIVLLLQKLFKILSHNKDFDHQSYFRITKQISDNVIYNLVHYNGKIENLGIDLNQTKMFLHDLLK
ncbi:hypothetical protein H312_00532 [Anncaliia algerae PRA339]|uniref:Uncharacterized protein n=1 Tax=Anncaliia algerae PRA339 TaxID=1288291 RepID=A0A059F4G0_9MICR|nr:hypothetical protein H312_00532 [Anncaliia algerae PRA339]